MPSAVTMVLHHQKIIHSSVYLTSVYSILPSIASSRCSSPQVLHQPVKIAVVGSGQSASEVVIDLRSKLQDRIPLLPDTDGKPAGHEIYLIMNRGSLKPSDCSPFSNEIFDPACSCERSQGKLAVHFSLRHGSVFRSEEWSREAHSAQ